MIFILCLYIASILYSTIRYVVFAPANLEHLPIFVFNKGISMAAALCFSMAFVSQWSLRRSAQPLWTSPQVWFRGGIFGVFLHIPMSLAILEKSYFKEFFHENGRLDFNGELVFLFGAMTAGGIYLLTRPDWTSIHRWWLSLATMLVLFSHTLSMGVARGLNINRSHAYLPPMWLLSLLGISLGIAFLLMVAPKRENEVSGPSLNAE